MINGSFSEIYGMANPTGLPFLRYPPGIVHPMFSLNPKFKDEFSNKAQSMNAKLKDFTQMYQKYASSLITRNRIIPPNHPLFNDKESLDTLQQENDKLCKENIELKKQLEKLNKEHTHR